MMTDRSFSRRSFLKGFGAAIAAAPFVTSGMLAHPPGSTLRHASFGAGGMAWSDLTELAGSGKLELVAVADVDLNRTVELRKRFPRARVYQDWRTLLDREAHDLDSVNVSTPDHMHAVIAASAMQLGKHVYGQKPLAHDLSEVRALTRLAQAKRLVTQMGIQIHSTNHYQMAVIIAQAGYIGKIKEVHSWCPKSWGDPSPLPARIDRVPKDFAWSLWLGVCAERPFIGDGYYHPSNWRKRLDFGTGTFGDMGCHIFDPVFSALELQAPVAVRSEGPAPNQWNWAMDSRIEYVFPGTRFTQDKTIKVTWYDGAQQPPAQIRALLEGDDLPNTGSIFVGTQGVMVLPHVNRPLLYPDAKFKDYKLPEVSSKNHWGEFVNACLGKARTTADFSYAGPLTEAVLLGGVASRFPKTTLLWDSEQLRFNLAEANQFVRREYRAGWGSPAL